MVTSILPRIIPWLFKREQCGDSTHVHAGEDLGEKMSQLELKRQLDSGNIDMKAELDVLLPALGSAGDVHPMIELGIALKKRGHQATIITNALFEQQVQDAGL